MNALSSRSNYVQRDQFTKLSTARKRAHVRTFERLAAPHSQTTATNGTRIEHTLYMLQPETRRAD